LFQIGSSFEKTSLKPQHYFGIKLQTLGSLCDAQVKSRLIFIPPISFITLQADWLVSNSYESNRNSLKVIETRIKHETRKPVEEVNLLESMHKVWFSFCTL